MKSPEILAELELAASNQWGIISTAQAERSGVTRLQLGRLADKEIIYRARRGIYYLPSVAFSALTDIRAAWIALDPSQYIDERWQEDRCIAVSHESAAELHALGDLIPSKMTFSASYRKQTAQSDIRVVSNCDLPSSDVINLDGLPVTSVERTIADLAAKRIEKNYLATIVADGLRKEGVRYEALTQRLDPVAQFYGERSGEALVSTCQDEAASVEDNREVLRRAASIVDPFRGFAGKPLQPLLAQSLTLDEAHKNYFSDLSSMVEAVSSVVALEIMKTSYITELDETMRRFAMAPPIHEIIPELKAAISFNNSSFTNALEAFRKSFLDLDSFAGFTTNIDSEAKRRREKKAIAEDGSGEPKESEDLT